MMDNIPLAYHQYLEENLRSALHNNSDNDAIQGHVQVRGELLLQFVQSRGSDFQNGHRKLVKAVALRQVHFHQTQLIQK